MTSTLDNILSNPGLIDIRDQIFGYFDHETLEVCCEVFAQRFGGDWDVWLKRLTSIQCMIEFGDKMVAYSRRKTVKDFIPGWDKGVKSFGNMASLKDLNEVKGSMRGLFLDLRGCCGRVKCAYGINFVFKRCYCHPLIVACRKGSTEIVNFLVRSSKEFGIDLNARNDDGETGFMRACYYGQTEIVKLMINSSKEFGIDLNVRNVNGDTGFMLARVFGYRKIVKLMVNASREFNINIDA